MENINISLNEKILNADELFEKKYFEEALFEYRSILKNMPLQSLDSIKETKIHFFNILKEKSYCLKELDLYSDSIELYVKIIYFLDKHFNENDKLFFIKEHYSYISDALIEAYLESDVLEKEMNYREALLVRQKTLRLFDLICINIGDLLFYKSPYEFIKQANLSKLLGQLSNAEKYFLLSIKTAHNFFGTDSNFFKTYLEEAYHKLMLFYEDFDENQKLNSILDEYIEYSEKKYKKGESINFEALANSLVKKALLSDDLSTRHKLFQNALTYYEELEIKNIIDKTYYNIAYVEINISLPIDKEEKIKDLEELCEFFLQKSHYKHCNYYYLLILKDLLVSYFHKHQLFEIFKISKSIHINKEKLTEKEKLLYNSIELFSETCELFLEFQKAIFSKKSENCNKKAKNCYKNALLLWKQNFITKKDFIFVIYTIANLYRHTIKNDTEALFYLKEISYFYLEGNYDENSKNIFANTFFELGLYNMEAGDFQDSIGYLSKAIQLFKELYEINNAKYKLKLHLVLIERAVLSYNFFYDYDSFMHSINEGINYLKTNIDNWKDLYRLLKALDLKGKVLDEKDEKNLLIKLYKEIYDLYHSYTFNYSGKLHILYEKNMELALNLAKEMEIKELEELFETELAKN